MSFEPFTLELPYPPSVNTYYRRRKGQHGMFISDRGLQYRADVLACVLLQPLRATIDEKMCIEMLIYAPDQRVRDIDNPQKATFDAICKAGVYRDDSLIRELHIKFADEIVKFGKIRVTISPLCNTEGTPCPEGKRVQELRTPERRSRKCRPK
jgi:crossover junction endodeoxyribonuclease RusA